jgi:hypothetical protein
MRRAWGWILALVLVLLLAWAGYGAYQAYRGLASRVSALEAQVQAQGETLKALSERLGKVEEEVFKTPAPPISLPEAPEVSGGAAWPYVVGLLLVLLLAYLLLRFLRTPEKGAKEEAPPSSGEGQA